MPCPSFSALCHRCLELIGGFSIGLHCSCFVFYLSHRLPSRFHPLHLPFLCHTISVFYKLTISLPIYNIILDSRCRFWTTRLYITPRPHRLPMKCNESMFSPPAPWSFLEFHVCQHTPSGMCMQLLRARAPSPQHVQGHCMPVWREDQIKDMWKKSASHLTHFPLRDRVRVMYVGEEMRP